MAEQDALSKSAKKRAAKKVRDAAHAEEPAPPAPEPKAASKPKAEPKAKAAEPKAAPKAKSDPKAAPKAKSEPKAEPKAKADAKAKGKAKAKAEPAAKTEPKPEPKSEAKPEPKAASKSKAKKAAPPPPPEPVEEAPKKVEDLVNYVIDDGTGGSWEVSTGLSKKKEKELARKEEMQKMIAQTKAAGGIVGAKNIVPGMADPATLAANKVASSQAASADVNRILAMKAAPTEAVEPVAAGSTVTINVPEQRIGVVIGPKGATIKMIQEKTKVKGIDTAGNIFTVTGSASAVAEAETAINELISKGFCSMQYEDFSENFVSVHPSYFPDLIGKGGCIIQKIKAALKVEVNMPATPPSPPPGKKFKVTLAGSAKQVEEAKEVINSIMMYGHHEVTHPGEVHSEIEVDNWSLRYIIGKGGSEMKHIQKNWNVKLGIPREHSVNQNVLIIGELASVERAQAYIEKVMWNAANASKGRDRQDAAAGDDVGDEEVEDWMRPYIYKR